MRLSELVAKGAGDCGAHEWYHQDDTTWRCYHCEVGLTHVSPFSPLEEARGRIAAVETLLSALEHQPPGADTSERYRELFAELRSLLHTEPMETLWAAGPAPALDRQERGTKDVRGRQHR